MPDALFFVLQFLGIESFNLDASIARQGGCFPYTNDYPLSHSLAGMVGAGTWHPHSDSFEAQSLFMLF